MVKIALLPTKLVLDENGTWSFQNKKIQDSFKSEGGNERLGFLTQNSQWHIMYMEIDINNQKVMMQSE